MQIGQLKFQETRRTGESGSELTRDRHGVPQRGSFGLLGPHGKLTTLDDITAVGRSLQIEKRQMVGGPFAALSGGTKRCSLSRQGHRRTMRGESEDHQGTVSTNTSFLRRFSHTGRKSHTEHTSITKVQAAYFFGRTSTLADMAEFFKVPPTINGPRGVKTIPRSSARTS